MRRPSSSTLLGLAVIGIFAYLLAVAFLTPMGTVSSLGLGNSSEPLSYDSMMEMIEDEQVSRAHWYDYVFTFEDMEGHSYSVREPITFLLEDAFRMLREQGVDVVIGPPEESSASRPGPVERVLAAANEMTNFVFLALPVIIVLALLFILRHMMGNSGAGPWPRVVRGHEVRFADVAGHDETRFELEEIAAFLKNPEDFVRVGARPPKGVLLVGPPGTGKTLMAKALAGECGAAFIPVAGSDFSSMFVGTGRARIKKVFETARKHAPAIVFIDEIDSMARKRGGDSSAVSQEKDLMLNQLLVQMDGFDYVGPVIVIAATNRVDVLDPALLRPGRFDRQIHVGVPDRRGREAILGVHAKGKPMADDVDLAKVARGTPGFSGAHLANLVNEAAIMAAREKAESITATHFERARDKIVMGVARRSLVLDDEEKSLVAHHEAGHALVACLLKHSDPVHQATIIPHGESLGSVMRTPAAERVGTIPRNKLIADLKVTMGGRAAEAVIFGEEAITTGAASDIRAATDLAIRMVCEWGMSEHGMVMVQRRNDGTLPAEAETAVRTLLDECYRDAVRMIDTHHREVKALASALIERETLSGDEVRAIVEGHA